MGEETTIMGTVLSVVFQNEENGYAVLRLVTDDGEILTLVGCVPCAAPGENLTATGSFSSHPQYGEQFSASEVERYLPSNETEILNYLASGVVRGVGPATAEKLVARFGIETLQVLESEPEKLTAIKGMTARRAQEISAAFNEQMGLRRVMEFLAHYDLPAALSVPLYRRFGANAMAALERNPYLLSDSAFGVDFSVCDEIALSMGFGGDASLRTEAGLTFELSHNRDAGGHVFLPREKLLAATAQLLDCDIDAVEKSLDDLIAIHRIVQEGVANVTACYLRQSWEDETYVVTRIEAMLADKPDALRGVERTISEIEREQGVQYAPLQRQAVELAAKEELLLLTGGPGTGKTTIANIIANRTNKTLYRLNATTASLQDVKSIISDVGTMMAPGGILLYLDEIQYFNKKQQQSLLEFMENGSITLIASTTENPYFYVYGALLSRSTVFEFKNVSAEETIPAVERALGILKEHSELPLSWEDDVPRVIAQQCGGDVRKAVSACELLYEAADVTNGELLLKSEDALQVAQRSAMRYDKGGDAMYDCASALMKSLRGSDPDAALHYLARFLEAGDLVTPCRRLLCSASEDVGMAYPQAIAIVKACVDTAMQLGLPEAQLPLAQAAVLLATAPKSNSVIEGIGAAWADVKAGKSGNFPRCLQNVHADSTGGAQGQNYKYPHAYPNHWVKQQYLPDELKNVQYYHYGDNKVERAAAQYWEAIKG